MLLRERIEEINDLSDSQKHVLDYIFNNPYDISNKSLKEIAEATYTSPATLVRLAKKLNYQGFEELRNAFLDEEKYINNSFKSIDANVPFSQNDDYVRIANKLATLNEKTAKDTLSLLNYDVLKRATNILLKSETIHLTAISFPLIHGYDFQLKMRKLGKKVEIVDILGEQLYAEPIVKKDDCALLISYSGETPLICQMLPIYKEKHIPIIAITSIGDSTLRNNADICLSISTREKLYSKIAGFSNGYSIQLILDILYSCVFKNDYVNNFNKKIELSKKSEPGRFATYEKIKE